MNNKQLRWLANGHCAIIPHSNVKKIEKMFQTNKDLELAHASVGTLVQYDGFKLPDYLKHFEHILNTKSAKVFFRPHSGTFIESLGWMIVPMGEILLIELEEKNAN